MDRNGFRTVASLVFSVIALLQCWRALAQVPVQVGATAVPVAASWIAVVVFGSLAVWGFRSRS